MLSSPIIQQEKIMDIFSFIDPSIVFLAILTGAFAGGIYFTATNNNNRWELLGIVLMVASSFMLYPTMMNDAKVANRLAQSLSEDGRCSVQPMPRNVKLASENASISWDEPDVSTIWWIVNYIAEDGSVIHTDTLRHDTTSHPLDLKRYKETVQINVIYGSIFGPSQEATVKIPEEETEEVLEHTTPAPTPTPDT